MVALFIYSNMWLPGMQLVVHGKSLIISKHAIGSQCKIHVFYTKYCPYSQKVWCEESLTNLVSEWCFNKLKSGDDIIRFCLAGLMMHKEICPINFTVTSNEGLTATCAAAF